MNKGLFFYQLPNTNVIQGYEGQWDLVDTIENCNDGFVLTSFNKEQIFSMSDYSQVDLSKLSQITFDAAGSFPNLTKLDYEKLVNSAIEFCIQENGKVVLSRVKRHQLQSEFSLEKMFKMLCAKYSHAFNYVCHIPNVGTWMGASPEKLLVGKVPHFEIASLAGSRSVDNKFDWSEKEINEQQVVTESIERILKTLAIDYEKSETKTVQAGNVEHLFTGFRTNNCNKPLRLAEQLHPTPAVSGFPKEKAINFINSYESHQRELYAGIVGFVHRDRLDLYVNLRCAKIHSDYIDLFVGGGVTTDSIPSIEWEETEFKSQTLLSIIEKM